MAITGSDEIASAAAMNRAKMFRWSRSAISASGMPVPARTRAPAGDEAGDRDDGGGPTQPADEAEIGLGARRHQQEHDAEPADGEEHRGLDLVVGEQQSVTPGATRPSTEGPSNTPAPSSPTTAGWPKRCMSDAEQPGHDEQHEDGGEEHQDVVLGGWFEVHRVRRIGAPYPAAVGSRRVSGVTSATCGQLKSTLEKSASLSILWRALTSRTVPDFERMTSDWVVAPRLS